MAFWRMGLGDRVFWSIDICVFVGLVWLKYGAPYFGLTWGLVTMLVVGGIIVESKYLYTRVRRSRKSGEATGAK
jgi:hypothetical protein